MPDSNLIILLDIVMFNNTKRNGLHSIPEFTDWSNDKLLAKMEETEKENDDPSY